VVAVGWDSWVGAAGAVGSTAEGEVAAGAQLESTRASKSVSRANVIHLRFIFLFSRVK
jgi:hypothetical protein